MPNISILSPSSFNELEEMMEYAVNEHTGPIAIRYPRGSTQADYPRTAFKYGKAATVQSGKDLSIICAGRMICRAQEVANILKSSAITCDIIALPTIKPLDCAAVLASAMKCRALITIEDNVQIGGIGSMIAELLMEKEINTKFKAYAFPDEPIVHGSIAELDKKYGIDAQTIAVEVYKWLK
jgi:1-deoxy-D-xylulose-5-phosphate synthase